MNNVAALKVRSRVVTTPVSHALQPVDGKLVAEILGGL
jgi:hypothetical protein